MSSCQDPAISSNEYLLKSSTVISFSTVSVANGRTKSFCPLAQKVKSLKFVTKLERKRSSVTEKSIFAGSAESSVVFKTLLVYFFGMRY